MILLNELLEYNKLLKEKVKRYTSYHRENYNNTSIILPSPSLSKYLVMSDY